MTHKPSLRNPVDILALSDVADLLGMAPTAVANWRKRYPDFPKPFAVVSRGKTPLFDRREVIEWWKQRTPALTEVLRGEA